MLSFTNNRVLLVNYFPKYWNNPEHPRHPRNPWETHEYLHTLNTEPDNEKVILRGAFLTHNPKGLKCETSGYTIKITGKLAPFNEQTEPKTILPLEQMTFTGSNFFNNGRYAGNEYAFLVKANAVISYEMDPAHELDLEWYMHNDFDVLYPERVKEFIYMEGLSNSKKFYPWVPNISEYKFRKPTPAADFDDSGRYYGPIWIPRKAGKPLEVPDTTHTFKDRFWYNKPKDQIDDLSESEYCNKIIKENHPRHYICIHNNEKRWSWFDRLQFNPWQPKKSPNNNLEYIEDVSTWTGGSVPVYPPERQIFFTGRPAGERPINLGNILNENSGKLLKTHCYVWDRDTKTLHFYGIVQKTFILKLVKNHYIEHAIACYSYLSKNAPFHIDGKKVSGFEAIKEKRKQIFDFPDYIPDPWIEFRDTPKKPSDVNTQNDLD